MTIEPYKIESESEADYYLQELLKHHKYRSMNEVIMRAQQYIKDDRLKNYFINKAKEMLKTYGHEIE